jgi:hypothetical protein
VDCSDALQCVVVALCLIRRAVNNCCQLYYAWTLSSTPCDSLEACRFGQTYELHEAKAYSLAWNNTELDTEGDYDALTVAQHDANPNDLIFTEKLWPQNCEFSLANPVRCGSPEGVPSVMFQYYFSEITDLICGGQCGCLISHFHHPPCCPNLSKLC